MKRATPVLVALIVFGGVSSSPAQDLGAVPGHVAITNAEAAVGETLDENDRSLVEWFDADIRPLAKGWCVVVHGLTFPDGKRFDVPVFVQQDGRAWRADAVGRATYDGGADGRVVAPGTTWSCVPVPKARRR